MKKSSMRNAMRVLSVLLALVIALALTGCAKSEDSEIAKLFEDGYTVTMMSADEEKLGVLLQKDGSLETVYMAKAAMSSEKYEAYGKAMDTEDSDAALVKYLCELEGLQVSDITSTIPSAEKLNEYVGMTFGELEEQGYENSGWVGEAGDYAFSYDGPQYVLNVKPEAGTMPGDMDDYSDNDIRALTIGEVEFAGFSFYFFDGIDVQ